MDGQSSDPPPPNQPQSLEELRLGSHVFGAGPGDYDAAAEDAAQAFFRKEYRNTLRLYSRLIILDSSKPLGWLGYVLSLQFMNQANQASLWARNAERALASHPIGKVFGLCAARISGQSSPSPNQWHILQDCDVDDFVYWILLGWFNLLTREGNPMESFRKAVQEDKAHNWQTPMFAGVLLEKFERITAAEAFFAQARILLDKPLGLQSYEALEPSCHHSSIRRSLTKLFSRLLR